MLKAIWFQRALQGIGLATWCSFSDALIQIRREKNTVEPWQRVICICCYSNLSKRFCQVLWFEMLQLHMMFDLRWVWHSFAYSLLILYVSKSFRYNWWTKAFCYTFVPYIQLCTYWNQKVHNNGSWSASFMTSLTKSNGWHQSKNRHMENMTNC